MKLKNGVTLESVKEKLRGDLSSHINVTIDTNPFYKNVKWICVDKDAFVGVKIFLKDNELLLDSYIPNFAARTFFGGIISGIFHHGARRDFKNKIANFLVSEFYEE